VDHDQTVAADDARHLRGADDRVDHDQTVWPDGHFAHHDLCEDDAQNQNFRRVAWHLDAIAKATNKD
ncbi:MAG: hypothetical protein ACKO73_08720, partial [Acidimicrobiaceae bacterium]